MQIQQVRTSQYKALIEVNVKIKDFNKQIPELFKEVSIEEDHIRRNQQKNRNFTGAVIGVPMAGAGAVATGLVVLIPFTIPLAGVAAVAGGVFSGLGSRYIMKRIMRDSHRKEFRNHVNAKVALPFLEDMLEEVQEEMTHHNNVCLKRAHKNLEKQITHHEKRLKA